MEDYTRIWGSGIKDLQAATGTTLTMQCSSATAPAISRDGRYVATETGDNVYVWDSQTGSNVLVSVNLLGTGGGIVSGVALFWTWAWGGWTCAGRASPRTC